MAGTSTPKKAPRAGDWTPAFLASLREDGNVRRACEAAGVDRKGAYAHRDRNPRFAADWQRAIDDACDTLEAVARERARASSDTLLIFLLKVHRYHDLDRQPPATLDVTVRHEHSFGFADLAALFAAGVRAELPPPGPDRLVEPLDTAHADAETGVLPDLAG